MAQTASRARRMARARRKAQQDASDMAHTIESSRARGRRVGGGHTGIDTACNPAVVESGKEHGAPYRDPRPLAVQKERSRQEGTSRQGLLGRRPGVANDVPKSLRSAEKRWAGLLPGNDPSTRSAVQRPDGSLIVGDRTKAIGAANFLDKGYHMFDTPSENLKDRVTYRRSVTYSFDNDGALSINEQLPGTLRPDYGKYKGTEHAVTTKGSSINNEE